MGAFRASTTRAEALALLAETLRRAGIEDPAREARMTIGAACGVSNAAMIAAPEEPLGAAADRLANVAARRAAGEPLSRIVGKREFWGLALSIAPQVLDPRPETETVIEAALTLLRDRRLEPLRILDLGVGSGALLCGLLTAFEHGRGVGVDVCASAARVALDNVEACGLAGRAEIRVGDWSRNLVGPFDLIVSNPPYIRSVDIAGLSREVRDFDPRLALDGGSDGLDAYRKIAPASARLLNQEGWLLVEIGAERASEVLAIARVEGFVDCEFYRDLSGLERVMAARTPRTDSMRWKQ